jgi:drug/metabolite transporter (DMT)-like permease
VALRLPNRSWAGTGLALVVLTAGISGVSTFVNAYAVQGTNSDAFVTVRNLATVVFLVPLALLGARSVRAPLARRQWATLVLIGLVGGAIPFLLFFRGVELATAAGGAASASFVYRTLFLFATVFGLVVLRERLRWWITLVAALLLAGNYLLLSLVGPVWTDGFAYVLAATVLWAVEYTISRWLLRDVRSSTVGLGRMGFGAAFLVAYLAGTGQLVGVAAFSGGEWQWVVISALLLTAFVATWYAGLARVDVSVATSILVLGFPVTWLLDVLLHGSPLLVGQLAGALIVAAGVGVALVGAASPRSAPRLAAAGPPRGTD